MKQVPIKCYIGSLVHNVYRDLANGQIDNNVHYVYGDLHAWATIANLLVTANEANQICSMTAELTVFASIDTPPFTDVVLYDEGAAPGTWHWPERKEA